jgi:phosphonate transport system permease protein
MSTTATVLRHWSPPPFIGNPQLRLGIWFAVLTYLALATGSLEINWVRIAEGLERGWHFISAFARPNFTGRWGEISAGIMESLAMTVTATAIGVALAVPVGLGAARNLTVLPVYLFCRGLIALSRTFQEVIIAILFVKMFGFGPLAGMVTLLVGTVGFNAKLLAEDIESADPAALEAIRATGGSWGQLITYGVQPQVMPRFVGLAAYRLDINFRESSVIGIVGAGGIGSTLNTAFNRYEFNTAAAILLVIIAIVVFAEYSSGNIRRRFQ